MSLIMGSGISHRGSQSELKCPKDYDPVNFSKILNLYDKLDDDGNMLVKEDELTHIAIHHINNRKKLQEQKLADNEFYKKRNYQQKKRELDQKRKELDQQKKALDQKKKELEDTYKKEIIAETKIRDKNKEVIEKELIHLNNMSVEEQRKIFRQKLVGDDNSIDFWKFYDYMKTRVNDIDNISWTPLTISIPK